MRFHATEGESRTLNVPPECAGARLDAALTDLLPAPSRSFVKKLFDRDLVDVSPGKSKPAFRLKGGERVEVFVPAVVELSAEPEDIPLDALYEDEHLIVLNKPAGLVVHPSPGHETGTLVNALLHHCRDLSGIGGVLRPGIVHRLDRDTSGCLVAAKSDVAHQELAAQFAARGVEKRYLAITRGVPAPPDGKVEVNLGRHPHPKHRQMQAILEEGGRHSLTFYRTLEEFGDSALVECDIKTGRTHQIRVHLKSVGAPILCDETYGKAGKGLPSTLADAIRRQALHAAFLAFDHPVTEERMRFEAPLPEDMRRALDVLRRGEA